MSLLVRKISRAKWPTDFENSNLHNLRADALADLKTTNDGLSFWEIDSVSDVEKAILALATGSRVDDIVTVNVVYFEFKDFTNKNLSVVNDEEGGDTAITSLKRKHHNLINLDFKSLSTVAEMVVDALKCENTVRMTGSTVKKRLESANLNHEVDLDYLSDKMRYKLTGIRPTEQVVCPSCEQKFDVYKDTLLSVAFEQ